MIKVSEYINNPNLAPPCFVRGDALVVLRSMPNDCIDCVVTSPPYYMKRQYLGGGIGLEKTIDYINTNNPVINTLINSKIAYAKSENIITAIDITKDIKPMTGNDLCSIIGNVIDNAIEAELHEEESLRQLHIQAYWDDEEMVFHVSNYINETVLDRNSGLATTKEDKNSHGLGTNIVKSLAKRNYGTCDYYETENEFHCEIRW